MPDRLRYDGCVVEELATRSDRQRIDCGERESLRNVGHRSTPFLMQVVYILDGSCIRSRWTIYIVEPMRQGVSSLHRDTIAPTVPESREQRSIGRRSSVGEIADGEELRMFTFSRASVEGIT